MPDYPPVEDRECADDNSVLAADILLRRIHPVQITEEILPDNTRRFRPTSNAFKDSTKPPSPLSAAQQKLIPSIDQYMEAAPATLLVSFPASLPRSRGLIVSSVPLVFGEPEHVYIAGKKTGSIISQMARDCRWVIAGHVNFSGVN